MQDIILVGKCSICGSNVVYNAHGSAFLFTCLGCDACNVDERQTIQMKVKPENYLGHQEIHKILL